VKTRFRILIIQARVGKENICVGRFLHRRYAFMFICIQRHKSNVWNWHQFNTSQHNKWWCF